MIKLSQIFAGDIRNVFIEKNPFSFVSQLLIRSKASEAIRNSHTKNLSFITTTKSNYLTKFNSFHNVICLNKSSDAKNNSSIPSVDNVGKYYSKEEDEKLLEYVNKYGKSSTSLKSFSKDFGRSFSSIRHRIRKLESANEYDTNHELRAWEFEEDETLVNYIFKLKNIKSANDISHISYKDTAQKGFIEISKTFMRSTGSVHSRWNLVVIPYLKPHKQQLASSTNLKKDVLRLIEESYVKTTTLKGYSEADDKYIIQQVKKYGYKQETFVRIAKKLGKKYPATVKFHYDIHLSQTSKVKGPFSQEEDEKILNYIKVHGRSNESFKHITNELGRGSFRTVRLRHNRLVSQNEFETRAIRKNWELDEDQKLIDHIFKMKNVKDDGYDRLEQVKPNDFIEIGKELKRSSSSCNNRWILQIVPTLKSGIMKLPMTSDWKKDLLHHIVENKIKNKKELDIQFILKKVAPAQTSASLLLYLQGLQLESIDGVLKQSKLPLFEIVSKRLIKKDPRDPIFNEDNIREQKRQEWCINIIDHYKKLM